MSYFRKKRIGIKSDHVLLDTKSHENDLKDFSFTFIELPKFQKTLSDLQTTGNIYSLRRLFFAFSRAANASSNENSHWSSIG